MAQASAELAARALAPGVIARLTNVALRGTTLISKFVLVIFLAKILEPGQLGLYGLIAATVGYGIYAVGFEFYTVAMREMIGADPARRARILRNQAGFYGAAYMVAVPLLLLLFAADVLPWAYWAWLMVLLVLEHVAQELNRILVAMSEPLRAGVVLFLRSGAWCLMVVVLMWQVPAARDVDVVLGAWAAGAAISCALGLSHVLRANGRLLNGSTDWRWVRNGLKTALPLLVASLAVRGMFTVDRYWIENEVGLDVLGAYVLFIGIATAVLSFVDAAVVDFAYPRIVASAKRGDTAAFRHQMKGLGLQTTLVTAVLAVACMAVSAPLLHWLDRPIYADNAAILPWVLLAMALYALSTIPHVGLYAHGKDKPLLAAQLLGFVVFLVAATLGHGRFGALGVPYALCWAFGAVLIAKLAAYVLMQRTRPLRSGLRPS